MPASRLDDVRVASFDELDPTLLYRLLQLRVAVFVVEQQCPYLELDGRDLEPTTRHLWLARDQPASEPVGYLRVLAEPDGNARIGRVVVAREARGAGLAGTLLRAALALAGDRPCVLDAQSHLVDYYRGFGFEPAGPEFLEDGIPHVPMRRAG